MWIVYAFLPPLIVSLILYCALSPKDNITINPGTKALLVISHPDDESMFFTPLLSHLKSQQGVATYILCLSTGDYGNIGFGDVRKAELYDAALSVHGIPNKRVIIRDEVDLRDGKRNRWSHTRISHIIQETIRDYLDGELDMIFSFDPNGASGHVNHLDTCRGVRQAVKQLRADSLLYSESSINMKEQKTIELFELETGPIYRQFLGPLDIILQQAIVNHEKQVYIQPPRMLSLNHLPPLVVQEKKFVGRPFDDAGLAILTSYDTVLDSWKGMSKHESQFVWYRKAFVIFSKFSYVNTFWRR